MRTRLLAALVLCFMMLVQVGCSACQGGGDPSDASLNEGVSSDAAESSPEGEERFVNAPCTVLDGDNKKSEVSRLLSGSDSESSVRLAEDLINSFN